MIKEIYGNKKLSKKLLLAGLRVFLIGFFSVFVVYAIFLFINYFSNKIDNTSYNEKIIKLTKQLKSTSNEIDNILDEMTKLTLRKKVDIEKISNELIQLEREKNNKKTEINILEKIPIESVTLLKNEIQKLNDQSYKLNFWIGFVFMILGALLSKAVDIIINKFISKRKSKSDFILPGKF